mmetsp:Transcript_106301/g.338538  ORF Transcript_106301/g.338538 Transcript_106301/m.338538 type:complete len:253 (-) Transcript_106301:119-877(-)
MRRRTRAARVYAGRPLPQRRHWRGQSRVSPRPILELSRLLAVCRPGSDSIWGRGIRWPWTRARSTGCCTAWTATPAGPWRGPRLSAATSSLGSSSACGACGRSTCASATATCPARRGSSRRRWRRCAHLTASSAAWSRRAAPGRSRSCAGLPASWARGGPPRARCASGCTAAGCTRSVRTSAARATRSWGTCSTGAAGRPGARGCSSTRAASPWTPGGAAAAPSTSLAPCRPTWGRHSRLCSRWAGQGGRCS